MNSKNSAPPGAPKAPAVPRVAAEDDQKDEGSSIDTFSNYQPSALPASLISVCNGNEENSNDDPATTGLKVPSHTSSACESALLSSITAPTVSHNTAECLMDLLKSRRISPLQAEGVLLAIQRHSRIFHQTGERAGFFLGDGAGVGKGRQIAAVIRDALCRKEPTKRHLWLSVSQELSQDCKRDLTDIGCYCDIFDGSNLLDKSGALGKKDKGVLFLTYQLLVSSKRLEQLIEWCAGTERFKKSRSNAHKVFELESQFSGCIVFDEAHKAKNIADNTRTAKLVLELQRRLPKARVLYCSATGVSDVAHLAYAERLGLWNTGNAGSTHFNFPNFAAFKGSLESRGLGSLEMLALELKQQGSFLARTLSWDGAEFQNVEVELDAQQKLVYDQAVQWWTKCKKELEDVFTVLNSPAAMIWRNFWSAHQRFFKELAICAKVPYLARDALQQINEHGRSVVVGLQSTGEAGMQSFLEKYDKQRLENETFPQLVSTMSAVATNFVLNHFPVAQSLPVPPKLPATPPLASASPDEHLRYAAIKAEIDRIASLPPPEPIDEMVQRRQVLVDAIGNIDLPPNALDDLVDRLGGVSHVAEMTGRSGRMIRAPDYSDTKKSFVYSKRVNPAASSSLEDSERINLQERRRFMDGKKTVAIISDAASTGISLHAANGSGSCHRRRVHYTIELPWSADKAVQQLGRSHRSGQTSSPIYKLVVTSLGGERRFAAAVSKRMASLGALTKGDRRAATGSDMLSDFDLDSRYGKRALRRLYEALNYNRVFQSTQGENLMETLPTACLPARNAKAILNEVAQELLKSQDSHDASAMPTTTETAKYVYILNDALEALESVGVNQDTRSKANVRIFLNRLAGLAVLRQALVFELFMATLDDVIKEAKATGEFEGTAEDIKATTIEVGDEKELAIDPSCGVQTMLTTLVLDRGVCLEAVSSLAMDEVAKIKKASTSLEDSACSKDTEESTDRESQSPTKKTRAAPGFYVSYNQIAGRHLILFARPKFDPSTFQSCDSDVSFDPLRSMIITRPNTGTNLYEMSTKDLQIKYRLVLSCEEMSGLDLKDIEGGVGTDLLETGVQLVHEGSSKVVNMWKRAYEESFSFKYVNGLAPRKVKVALITGPVLHVLPALEMAVMARSAKEKALKIVRAETADSRRFVGVRFPVDDAALERLEVELKKLSEKRKNAGNSFVDQELSQMCPKSRKWATEPQKTMQSFFRATPVASSGSSETKRKASNQIQLSSTKKTKPSKISSFWAKK